MYVDELVISRIGVENTYAVMSTIVMYSRALITFFISEVPSVFEVGKRIEIKYKCQHH